MTYHDEARYDGVPIGTDILSYGTFTTSRARIV
jgi:hypothetical protein